MTTTHKYERTELGVYVSLCEQDATVLPPPAWEDAQWDDHCIWCVHDMVYATEVLRTEPKYRRISLAPAPMSERPSVWPKAPVQDVDGMTVLEACNGCGEPWDAQHALCNHEPLWDDLDAQEADEAAYAAEVLLWMEAFSV